MSFLVILFMFAAAYAAKLCVERGAYGWAVYAFGTLIVFAAIFIAREIRERPESR